MPFDNDNYGDYELGAEGHVPLNRGGDGQFSFTSPSGIQAPVSLIRTSIKSFKAEPPPEDLKAVLPYIAAELGDPHFPLPEDFVPRNARARMDTPLGEDFTPHSIWNFDKN